MILHSLPQQSHNQRWNAATSSQPQACKWQVQNSAMAVSFIVECSNFFERSSISLGIRWSRATVTERVKKRGNPVTTSAARPAQRKWQACSTQRLITLLHYIVAQRGFLQQKAWKIRDRINSKFSIVGKKSFQSEYFKWWVEFDPQMYGLTVNPLRPIVRIYPYQCTVHTFQSATWRNSAVPWPNRTIERAIDIRIVSAIGSKKPESDPSSESGDTRLELNSLSRVNSSACILNSFLGVFPDSRPTQLQIVHVIAKACFSALQ